RLVGRVHLPFDSSHWRHCKTDDLTDIIQGDVHIETCPLKGAGDDLYQTLPGLYSGRFSLPQKRPTLLFKPLPGSLNHSSRDKRPDAIRQTLLHGSKIAVNHICHDLLSLFRSSCFHNAKPSFSSSIEYNPFVPYISIFQFTLK